jgi:hypothetical protein
MSVQYQPSNPLSDSVNASNFAGSSISGDVGKSPAKTRRRSSVGVGATAGKDMSPRTLARRTAVSDVLVVVFLLRRLAR